MDDKLYPMFNTLRPRKNGRHFPDGIFKCIFLNEIYEFRLGFHWSIPELVQIMAWRRPGDKPLYEPMLVYLLTHICVTRPQWVHVGISIYAIPHLHACLTNLCWQKRLMKSPMHQRIDDIYLDDMCQFAPRIYLKQYWLFVNLMPGNQFNEMVSSK